MQNKIKVIPGTKGRYWAFLDGRIYSSHSQKILKGRPAGNGALYYALQIDKIRHNCMGHRLVVLAFKGKIPNGFVINHINNDPTDNRLVNLEIVTRSQNNLHCHQQGRANSGNTYSKKQINKIVELITNKIPISKVVKLTGISKAYAHTIKRRITKGLPVRLRDELN